MGSLSIGMYKARYRILCVIFDNLFLEPKQIHWDTAIRCLGYLKATDSFGLILGKDRDSSITCYSDSDWASNPIGHVYVGTSIIVWTSKVDTERYSSIIFY